VTWQSQPPLHPTVDTFDPVRLRQRVPIYPSPSSNAHSLLSNTALHCFFRHLLHLATPSIVTTRPSVASRTQIHLASSNRRSFPADQSTRQGITTAPLSRSALPRTMATAAQSAPRTGLKEAVTGAKSTSGTTIKVGCASSSSPSLRVWSWSSVPLRWNPRSAMAVVGSGRVELIAGYRPTTRTRLRRPSWRSRRRLRTCDVSKRSEML
jgi:hypothetical protein